MTPRVLDGCKALTVGIANEHAIANGCACAYPATSYARHMTGSTLVVDGGVNIKA